MDKKTFEKINKTKKAVRLKQLEIELLLYKQYQKI